MANPVFDKLGKEWTTTTPAGYPTMPGYSVGDTTASSTYTTTGTGAAQPTYGQTAWDQQTMEHAYAAPAADAVDRGRMTWDDVLVRTGTSFGLLLAAAVVAWWVTAVNAGAGVMLSAIGFLGGFVLALINSFSKTIRPALILAYAAFEGVALGAFSALMESMYPGIVVQAVLATAAVFGVTLLLFTSGKVRNSPKLARFVMIGLIGIIVYRLLNWVLVLTGVLSGGGFNDATIFGIPLGVAVGFLAVLIGAACLIQDFDQAKVGVERGVPAQFAWVCAFGLMVTVVWMYLEILQLLARLRD
ncbi:Bax inhibitor-1/YccA family protein [Schaalia suimastitidis]|uniref:Bax inhibitor-1/YccA family protein n=1 Tax=Schaalia suimastitidis TaxID=121163 RepID=UPI000408000E|nr:Bax inhibitor-1/YccA family protein [Schaalia suimastitidis]